MTTTVINLRVSRLSRSSCLNCFLDFAIFPVFHLLKCVIRVSKSRKSK